MPFSPDQFAAKLLELRTSFGASSEDVSTATGLSPSRLSMLETGQTSPTGDEILIVATYFSCDFSWLIEDNAENSDANLRVLFRIEGERISSADRRSIAEFIALCKNEAFLDDVLGHRHAPSNFEFIPKGWKETDKGRNCARDFREAHRLPLNAYIPDVFDWLRSAGFRVFRRSLISSPISGLFVEHPIAGKCILVNYTEDKYRQRFSAAHEAGHALMDAGKEFNLSGPEDYSSGSLNEMRANAFASAFLMPPELLQKLGSPADWNRPDKIVDTADRLWVSIPALLSALRSAGLIDDHTREAMKGKMLRLPEKREPELSGDLSPRQFERKEALLRVGLHQAYVGRCFEAFKQNEISMGRLSEMLLVDASEIAEIAAVFHVSI
jgi:Zn-dependent peptidase ImmA (M78 family)/transcriptional regulator with XRE-family HTH domain